MVGYLVAVLDKTGDLKLQRFNVKIRMEGLKKAEDFEQCSQASLLV